MIKELSHTNNATQSSERLPYSTPSVTNYGAVKDLTATGSKSGNEGTKGNPKGEMA